MLYIVYAVHVIICLFLIMVVLLQQGSGADLSVFGGGGTQTAFGARSATSLLHRLTVAGFVGFILTTIAFGFLKSGGGGESVMTGVEQAPQSEVDLEDTTVPATSEETVPSTESDSVEDATTPADAGSEDDPGGGDEAATPDTP